jgi:hypothetical protein
LGGAASAVNSPKNRNDLTGGSSSNDATQSINKNLNKALIEKAKRAAPMTEKAL